MKKGLIYAAVRNRKVTLFMAVLVMIFGMYSFYLLPRQETPDISAPAAMITTVYPGASPADVEKLVTSKIEDEILEIEGYDYFISYSKNSLSVVILMMNNNIDKDKTWDELRRKMDDIQDELPQGCQEINVNTDLIETAGMMISISGDGYSYEELATYAEELEEKLTKVEGVSRFDLIGKQEKEIKIEVDADRLNHYGFSLNDLEGIIVSQNIEIPSGQLNDKISKINVKTLGIFGSLKEIENTIVGVSGQTGAVVRLKDVAKVYMGLEDASYKIKHNGKNAVLLTGYFKENKNIVIIGKDVEREINQFKAGLPKDMKFDLVQYQPKDVERSVNDFIINLLEGILFVVIVVFIGMGIRNAVIVSTAIPLSIISTFAAMRLMGINIHQISVAALIIALGMLVDNAIVVSDAIQIRMDEGQERMVACVEGVREVAIPVLTSTLTTVGAFMPLLMLKSMAGDFIRSIPQIIIISLSASYIIALLVTPTMAYLVFRPGKKKEKVFRLRVFFDSLLKWGLQHKKKTVLISLAVFSLTVAMTGNLGLQFFPKADKNLIYIDVRTEQSTNINETERLADQVAALLSEQPEVTAYTVSIGDALPKFYHAMRKYSEYIDFAQFMIRVDLKKGNRFKRNTEMVSHLQEIMDLSLSGGTATVKELEQGEPVGAPVTVRVTGKNMERIEEAAVKVRAQLENISGTYNVEDDHQDRIYEFNTQIDSDKAGIYGISKLDVQKEINLALKGKAVSVFRRDGKEYDIVVSTGISSKEELERLMIKSSVTGKKVLLKEIAGITLKSVNPAIDKYDGELCITVTSDIKPGYSAVDIENQLKQQLGSTELAGADITFAGEKSKIARNFGDIGIMGVFSVLVVYTILLIQFSSFVQPLVIMLTIPLSMAGSILGLYAFRQPLSFTSLFGVVSLFGIVVNNAIVLLDYINGERREGKNVEEACKDAVYKRFRPIMLTTITTVIGLIPLIYEGNPLFAPMSISLAGGLILSTLLTLVVIPVVYSIIETGVEKRKKKKRASAKNEQIDTTLSI